MRNSAAAEGEGMGERETEALEVGEGIGERDRITDDGEEEREVDEEGD